MQPTTAPDWRSIHQRFVALFNAGDIDGLMALYEDGAVLHPSPGTIVQGKEGIRAALQGFLAVGGKLSIRTTAGFEAAGGIALTEGEWTLTGGSVELGGKNVEVLRRQADGAWLNIIDNPAA